MSGSRWPWPRTAATPTRSPSTPGPRAPRASGWTRSPGPAAGRSSDPREAALLAFLKALFEADGRPAAHLLEEAREVDWSDEQLLEAVAHLALSEFQSLMANAAALPQDQSDPSILPSAGRGLTQRSAGGRGSRRAFAAMRSRRPAGGRYLIGAARISSVAVK